MNITNISSDTFVLPGGRVLSPNSEIGISQSEYNSADLRHLINNLFSRNKISVEDSFPGFPVQDSDLDRTTPFDIVRTRMTYDMPVFTGITVCTLNKGDAFLGDSNVTSITSYTDVITTWDVSPAFINIDTKEQTGPIMALNIASASAFYTSDHSLRLAQSANNNGVLIATREVDLVAFVDDGSGDEVTGATQGEIEIGIVILRR